MQKATRWTKISLVTIFWHNKSKRLPIIFTFLTGLVHIGVAAAAVVVAVAAAVAAAAAAAASATLVISFLFFDSDLVLLPLLLAYY